MTLLTFDTSRLKPAIAAVRHAASDDKSRPILTTILFEGDADGFRLVAADNYRISIVSLPVVGDAAAWGRVAIPATDVDIFVRLMNLARSHVVTVELDDGTVRFAVAPYELVVRAMDGEFPDYRGKIVEVAPPEHAYVAVNQLYLKDLAKTASRIVRIGLAADPLAPVVVTGSVEEEGDYREYIMPVRTVETSIAPQPEPTAAEAVA